VQVNHLREKICGRRPTIITLRGLGYRFEP
jgi:DNA-binding response OmpR family regulator